MNSKVTKNKMPRYNPKNQLDSRQDVHLNKYILIDDRTMLSEFDAFFFQVVPKHRVQLKTHLFLEI